MDGSVVPALPAPVGERRKILINIMHDRLRADKLAARASEGRRVFDRCPDMPCKRI